MTTLPDLGVPSVSIADVEAVMERVSREPGAVNSFYRDGSGTLFKGLRETYLPNAEPPARSGLVGCAMSNDLWPDSERYRSAPAEIERLPVCPACSIAHKGRTYWCDHENLGEQDG